MKLKFINPDSGMSRAELAAREALLSRAAGPDTAISMDCPQRTQVCIDSDLDVAVAAPEIVQMALQAQADGFDAVCLYCFSDPGLSACRELLQIPVVGGAQASLALAAQLGHRFSVLTTAAGRIPQKAAFVRALGFGNALASVRSAEHGPNEGRSPATDGALVKKLAQTCRRCAEEDGADTVILGCLSFAGLGAQVSALAGLPVIDPAFTLVGIAELLVRQVQSPTLFEESIRWMASQGVDTVVEIGPGKVLSGFVKKIAPETALYQAQDAGSIREIGEALKGAQL